MKKEQLDIVEKVDRRKIVESLIKDGQVLLPFIDLICNAGQAIDELSRRNPLARPPKRRRSFE